jgi:hypothetical protein
MAEKFNKADFLYKNSWIFGCGSAIWNGLIFGKVVVLALFYCKKIVASPKYQNGVYLQDGVEYVL